MALRNNGGRTGHARHKRCCLPQYPLGRISPTASSISYGRRCPASHRSEYLVTPRLRGWHAAFGDGPHRNDDRLRAIINRTHCSVANTASPAHNAARNRCRRAFRLVWLPTMRSRTMQIRALQTRRARGHHSCMMTVDVRKPNVGCGPEDERLSTGFDDLIVMTTVCGPWLWSENGFLASACRVDHVACGSLDLSVR